MASEFGQHQSPIDIDYQCVKYDSGLKPINFEHSSSDCLEVLNKGSTWSIKVKENPQTKLTGSHLPGTYRLLEIHAHWGEKSNDGSEHLIGNKAYASELHMVHYNEKYSTVDEAKKHCDGLAVLGVLFEEGPNDNPALEPLIQGLQKVQFKGQSTQFSHGFDLAKLLPHNKDFCTYSGSLTTPPYSECVVWTVFVHPVPVSHRQLQVFRTLCANDEHEKHEHSAKIINNARAAQTIGAREVRASFQPKTH
jgi:carbonic anhydrase